MLSYVQASRRAFLGCANRRFVFEIQSQRYPLEPPLRNGSKARYTCGISPRQLPAIPVVVDLIFDSIDNQSAGEYLKACQIEHCYSPAAWMNLTQSA